MHPWLQVLMAEEGDEEAAEVQWCLKAQEPVVTAMLQECGAMLRAGGRAPLERGGGGALRVDKQALLLDMGFVDTLMKALDTAAAVLKAGLLRGARDTLSVEDLVAVVRLGYAQVCGRGVFACTRNRILPEGLLFGSAETRTPHRSGIRPNFDSESDSNRTPACDSDSW